MKRRVVISGLGAVSPNGIGKEKFWEGLETGKNCVDTISFFDHSEHPSKVAAEIREFEPLAYMSAKELRSVHRVVPLSVAATGEALADAMIGESSPLKGKMGVVLGTGAGGLGFAEEQIKIVTRHGLRKMSPHSTTATFVGMSSSELSIRFGLRGMSVVVSTGCASSRTTPEEKTSFIYIFL